ncbi:MAG: DegT/DnrJ/EryC1/StrS family aminotransferase [Terriglobales bacterium]
MTAARTEAALAIAGGAPLRTRPFAPWPVFAEDEIEAAVRVLASGRVNYWTGEEGRRFEEEFAAVTQRKRAVALANGSVALELALYALGIGPGDEVIVPSRSFIASASCVVLRGATPVFADVDRESQNLTAETAAAALSPRTKAIIAVHLAGWPCEMDALVALARQHSLKLIEDCAQALGATYKGRPVGAFGDLAAFSFCQDKIISTGGEGGMLVMDNEALWNRAWSYKDHGKSYDAVYNRPHAPGFRWVHESLGTNWRMTEMQSAMGRVLLKKVPERVEQRRRLAAILSEGFARHPALRVATPPPGVGHSYYKCGVFLRPERLRPEWNHGRVLEAVSAEGVPCVSGGCSEVYLEKGIPQELRPRERLKIARELDESCLSFLVHPTLTEDDMRDTCRAVEKVLAVACV